uniref:Uncharacterized protein n=1 Tax=Arundo donax TaxID=35708 RepID=A0A0A9GJB3_ARUDO
MLASPLASLCLTLHVRALDHCHRSLVAPAMLTCHPDLPVLHHDLLQFNSPSHHAHL